MQPWVLGQYTLLRLDDDDWTMQHAKRRKGKSLPTSTANPPPERPEPNSHLWVPKPGLGGIAWPAASTGPEAMRIAVVHQLQQTQWWPPQALVEMQMRQFALLARHAAETVPFYRDRLDLLSSIKGGELTPEIWRKLPVLTRSEIQDTGDSLISTDLPPDHGRTFDVQTSGSTGRPVRVKGTSVTRVLNSALNLRNHLWHGRDFSASVGAIQTLSPNEAGRRRRKNRCPGARPRTRESCISVTSEHPSANSLSGWSGETSST